MNNVGTNRTYGRKYETRTPPAWLVEVCKIILWLTHENTVSMLRTVLAIGAVTALAIVAGAMEFGGISFLYGTIICASLAGIAILATRD